MPSFTPETPTIERTFIGHTFRVPTVFTEGHALTAAETKWFNSQLASVVANAFSGDVRRAVEALTVSRIEAVIPEGAKRDKAVEAFRKSGAVPEGVTKATQADLDWDMQSAFNDKFSSYDLGVSNRTGFTTDPVQSLVHALAESAVKALLKSKGLKLADYQKAKAADGTTSKFVELVSAYKAKHPELTATAEAQLAASADTQDADGLDLTI